MKAIGERKICYNCKVDKHISDFSKRTRESDGLSGECKNCVSIKKSGKPYGSRIRRYTSILINYENNTKLCTECNITRDLSYFPKTKTRGYQSKCRECKRVRDRVWQYNISKEEYLNLLLEQNNTCAICNIKEEGNRNLAIDHCHTTGKVRGLLCVKCNTSLGGFNDNIELLMKAIEYLKKTKKEEPIEMKNIKTGLLSF